jgi:hypothetical protein
MPLTFKKRPAKSEARCRISLRSDRAYGTLAAALLCQPGDSTDYAGVCPRRTPETLATAAQGYPRHRAPPEPRGMIERCLLGIGATL